MNRQWLKQQLADVNWRTPEDWPVPLRAAAMVLCALLLATVAVALLARPAYQARQRAELALQAATAEQGRAQERVRGVAQQRLELQRFGGQGALPTAMAVLVRRAATGGVAALEDQGALQINGRGRFSDLMGWLQGAATPSDPLLAGWRQLRVEWRGQGLEWDGQLDPWSAGKTKAIAFDPLGHAARADQDPFAPPEASLLVPSIGTVSVPGAVATVADAPSAWPPLPLSQQSLSHLRYVGTIGVAAQRQGLLLAGNTLYRVAVGDRIGMERARITAIAADRLIAGETVLALPPQSLGVSP
ncbi:pilus assembly protein PilP [Aquilutibacter rugosus]|uniref:pilus assembly protein PilP n=1 Tax=Aquilutibacter rugosus TaxID=3115820 RepID=UPI002F429DE6